MFCTYVYFVLFFDNSVILLGSRNKIFVSTKTNVTIPNNKTVPKDSKEDPNAS